MLAVEHNDEYLVYTRYQYFLPLTILELGGEIDDKNYQ